MATSALHLLISVSNRPAAVLDRSTDQDKATSVAEAHVVKRKQPPLCVI